jgi:hypothetical protein
MDKHAWMRLCNASASRSSFELQQANYSSGSVAVSSALRLLCCLCRARLGRRAAL